MPVVNALKKKKIGEHSKEEKSTVSCKRFSYILLFMQRYFFLSGVCSSIHGAKIHFRAQAGII